MRGGVEGALARALRRGARRLDLIGKQLHFNLDILQNKKSDSLEWIIIILISVEILVSLSELWLHLPGPK